MVSPARRPQGTLFMEEGTVKKKHSWEWQKRGWGALFWWRKPSMVCVKCGARMRRDPLGPRDGKRTVYKGPGAMEFRVVSKLPPCEVFDFAAVSSAMKQEFGEFEAVVNQESPIRRFLRGGK